MFDPDAVDPPLTEAELLEPFRAGSVVLYRSVAQIAEFGLVLMSTDGADLLSDRLRAAHREIVPGMNMTRSGFKAALKLLE
ncbi:MAG: hypothetical protein ACRC7O_11220 [Fimbriiglobus sp.]